jgi:TolB-like protein
VGTEGFIPPEGPGTPQADVYGLGKTLYEMVAGQDRRKYPDLPPDLKEWPEAGEVLELNQIILKACEEDPHRRYRAAAQMHQELALLEEGRSVQRRRRAQAARKAGLRWAAILTVAVLGLFLAVSLARRKPAATDSAAAEKASIFVLPFRPTVAVEGDVNLHSRITDAFIDSLALVKGVRVGPRKSGWVTRDETQLRQHVKTNYAVGHVLTGKVDTPPGRVGIELTLFQAEGDRVLWSETFAGNSNEVVALERRGLERIATILGLTITEEEQRLIDRKLSNNLAAYSLACQAGDLYNLDSRDAALQRMDLYYRALKLDPLYLSAENWAAYQHRYLAGDRTPRETWEILRHRASRVLEVDDTHYFARYSLMAVTFQYDWDWEKLDAMFVQHLADWPGPESMRWLILANYHRSLGWFELAEVEWTKGLEANPKCLNSSVRRGIRLSFLWVTRRYDEGLQCALEGVPLFPGNGDMYYWTAAHAIGKGDYRQAIEALRKAAASEDAPHLQAQLGYAYGRMGDQAKAEEVIKALDTMARGRYVQPYMVARVYAGMGEKDEAFRCLEKAVEDRCEELIDVFWGGLMADPAWDDMRDDPRFFELRKKTGLDVWPRPTKTIPTSLGITNRTPARVLP